METAASRRRGMDEPYARVASYEAYDFRVYSSTNSILYQFYMSRLCLRIGGAA